MTIDVAFENLKKCVGRIDDALGMVQFGDDADAVADGRADLLDEIETLRGLADKLEEEAAAS